MISTERHNCVGGGEQTWVHLVGVTDPRLDSRPAFPPTRIARHERASNLSALTRHTKRRFAVSTVSRARWLPKLPAKGRPCRRLGAHHARMGVLGDQRVAAAHAKVRRAAKSGRPAAFAPIVAGDELPGYDDDEFWDPYTVRGEWLATFVSTAHDDRHRRGLEIKGARIVGGLDLEAADLTRRLTLDMCQLGPAKVNLIEAHAPSLRLFNVQSGGIAADRAVIEGHLLVRESWIDGELTATGARIGGDFDCSRTEIVPTTGGALNADTAHIDGTVHLGELTAQGVTRLVGARIGGDLDCTGARLSAHNGVALMVNLAQVRGNVHLSRGLTADGTIQLQALNVSGNVELDEGQVNASDIAVEADGLQVTGDLSLRNSRCNGEVRLPGATIQGNLDADGAHLRNPFGDALVAEAAQIAGTVWLRNGFDAHGCVNFYGARVGVLFDATNGRFTSGESTTRDRPHPLLEICQTIAEPQDDTRIAVEATGLQVTGGFRIGHTEIDGELRLRNAEIGGDLVAGDAILQNPGGVSVYLSRARIAGSVFLTPRFTASGQVRLRNALVGSELDCQGANITGAKRSLPPPPSADDTDNARPPKPFPGEGDAINAAALQVGGSVILANDFTATGTVRLARATIGGDLDCRTGRFAGSDDEPVSLCLDRARIVGALYLAKQFTATGPVSLAGGRVGALHDDKPSWPDRIDLDGFAYDRIECPSSDHGWRARRNWLQRHVEPSPDIYVRLAAVYRSTGNDNDARRILIERHNVLLHPPAHWHIPTGIGTTAQKTWRWFLRLTIGHGFAPTRSLTIVLPLLAIMALWYTDAAHDDRMLPADETSLTGGTYEPRSSSCDDRYPCIQPVIYALDILIPLIDLGQRSAWVPDRSQNNKGWFTNNGRWLAAATWATSAIGWVLATLVAAGFTQLIRQE